MTRKLGRFVVVGLAWPFVPFVVELECLEDGVVCPFVSLLDVSEDPFFS